MSDKTPSPQSVVVPVERLSANRERFNEALVGIPDVADRRNKGQQFNAYDLDDEGERKAVCIGPITSRPLSLVEAPADVADLIEAALRLASDSLLASAPSSLAGGEVRDVSGETVMGMRVAAYRHPASCPPDLDKSEWLAFFNGSPPNTYCEHWSTPGEHRTDVERLFTEADVRRILAALSPEAPAREGAVKACADFQEAIDYFEADVADALAEDSERADLWDREVTVNIDALKTVMNAALTPRHEAPAETFNPAVGSPATRLQMGMIIAARDEAPAEGAGEVADRFEKYLTERARSRQLDPEDIHGMHIGDAREVVLTVADLRTAIIALRARSSAPEAREGEAVGAVYGCGKADLYTAELPDGTLLYTHPAAPSADKLRWIGIDEHDGGKAPVLLIGLYRDGSTWSDVYHGWWQPPFIGADDHPNEGSWARWPHPFPPTHFANISTPDDLKGDAK